MLHFPSRGPSLLTAAESFLSRVLEHESVLRVYLYRITRNASDVDELLQETYARLLTLAETEHEEPRSMRAFALTVARNVALSWLRRRQIVPMESVADLAELGTLDEGEQVEEIVNTHQELMLLREAVGRLPRRCREVFTLRRVYGLSQKEVANELGIAEHTVERHLGRALHQLAGTLFSPPISAPHSALLSQLTLTRRSRTHEDR
jgi:RNA polymerase sigma factor (sigma-70 family)